MIANSKYNEPRNRINRLSCLGVKDTSVGLFFAARESAQETGTFKPPFRLVLDAFY